MAESDLQPHAESDEEDVTPRSDLWQGVGWMVLGGAVLAGSVSMDRLREQNINPYTIPGLLPGILGAAMLLLGFVLAVRSWQRGALAHAREPFTPHQREVRRRVWTVIGLCVVYSVVLIGHGLPFWLGSAIFVTGSILVLHRMKQDPQARLLTPKVWLQALVIGVLAAVITQVVFQDVFLVRMP